ncbi:MAG: 16S rRNA (uracil(1498)-N(3))-methyltransferase [Bacteroidetes bacterium B1(2017)]|nr:MAG: 16S rRNA (uracil(1498)-N(3))-methyltransferase [Bacteroidetes bacterium B1(2017)]
MQLFYLADLSDSTFEFTEDESKHCIRVLRKKKGDELTLIDGKGTEAKGIIEQDNPKKCSGIIVAKTHHQRNKNYTLHLAIAPTKNFDRIEWMLEKIIEIGVDEISFIETNTSERGKINSERCNKIAVSAMKQSKQYYLPKINGITSLKNFLKGCETTSSKFIAYCPTPVTQTLFNQIPLPMPSHSILLIGPEGDFTQQEVEEAISLGFKPVSLGSNILRSETAGLVGVTSFANKAQTT